MSAAQEPCAVELVGDETEEQRQANARLRALSTTFTFRLPGQTIYKGLLTNNVVNPASLEAARQMTYRPDDVIVCGYFKTGTTWLGQILHLLLRPAELALGGSRLIYDSVLWLDDGRRHGKLQAEPAPRLLRTHLPWPLMPAGAGGGYRVCMMRNPKDTVVSGYHFHRSLVTLGGYEGSFGEFLEMFLAGYMHWGDYAEHVLGWWRSRREEKVLVLFYEDLHADPHAVVAQLARFLGLERSEESIARVVTATTFDKMKSDPLTNLSHVKSIRQPFMRKGVVGDWREHFTQEQSERLDAVLREKITDKALIEKFEPYM